MKLTTLGACGAAIGIFFFGIAIETEMEYEDIAIAGVLVISLLILWMITLLMELNTHFEKEELRSERNEQD